MGLRVIFTADDFGASSSINEAVERAFTSGVLTSASLMVNGDRTEEAVSIARRHPGLGLGLHLTLANGRSALEHDRIPDLAGRNGFFRRGPVAGGIAFAFNRELRVQIENEVEAQLKKFCGFGLPLDHVNGHLNMHLHPVVFDLLLKRAARFGVRAIRLTRDPFWFNASLSRGRWLYRAVHALIFNALTARAEPRLRKRSIQFVPLVFGLLQYGRMHEEYLAALIERLPEGDAEIYSHPSMDDFRTELEALTSNRLRQVVNERKVQLIRYGDLTDDGQAAADSGCARA